MMDEFVSEPIRAVRSPHAARVMASGLPGLPGGFVWRDDEYAVAECRSHWKYSAAEGHRAGGERYLRRHYFRLHMSDGSTWVVYFVRQAQHGHQRWFLYSRRAPEAPTAGQEGTVGDG